MFGFVFAIIRSRQVKDVVHFQRLQVLGDSALQAVQLAD